jgi:hypothetical protein
MFVCREWNRMLQHLSKSQINVCVWNANTLLLTGEYNFVTWLQQIMHTPKYVLIDTAIAGYYTRMHMGMPVDKNALKKFLQPLVVNSLSDSPTNETLCLMIANNDRDLITMFGCRMFSSGALMHGIEWAEWFLENGYLIYDEYILLGHRGKKYVDDVLKWMIQENVLKFSKSYVKRKLAKNSHDVSLQYILSDCLKDD